MQSNAFLEVSVGDRNVGRLTIELFWDAAPKACENFRALCTGEKGYSATSRQRLHYKGCPAHRLIPGFMVQMGDISSKNDGTGGESIYGSRFADEPRGLRMKHSSRGVLSMANSGKDTNSSQFFITFAPTPWLDGKHVVFGRVVAGEGALAAMERVVTGANDRPRVPVVISDCGLVADAERRAAARAAAGADHGKQSQSAPAAQHQQPYSIADDGAAGPSTVEELMAGADRRNLKRDLEESALPTAFGGPRKRGRGGEQAAAAGSAGGFDASGGAAAEAELARVIKAKMARSGAADAGLLGLHRGPPAAPEGEGEEADASSAPAGADAAGVASDSAPSASSAGEATHEGGAGIAAEGSGPLHDRLFALRMRLNAGRKANHTQVVAEHRRALEAEAKKPDSAARAANAVLKGAQAVTQAAKPLLGKGDRPASNPLLSAAASLPCARSDGSAFGSSAGPRKGGAGDGDEEGAGAAAGGGAAHAAKRARRNDDETDAGSAGAAGPADLAPAYMFEPASVAQAKAERREEKEVRKLGSFGWNIHNEDARMRAYERRLHSLPARADEDAAGAGSATPADYVDPAGLERLTAEMQRDEERRAKFHRRRADAGGSAGFISEDNRRYNAKVDRELGKYTVEVKQALERGTAL